MKWILFMLFAILLAGCGYHVNELALFANLNRVEELNNLLKNHKGLLSFQNKPDSVIIIAPQTKELVTFYQENLQLNKIEIIGTGENFYSAFYFGKPGEDETVLIHTYPTDSLEKYMLYEQFTDCAIVKKINQQWAYSQKHKCY